MEHIIDIVFNTLSEGIYAKILISIVLILIIFAAALIAYVIIETLTNLTIGITKNLIRWIKKII